MVYLCQCRTNTGEKKTPEEVGFSYLKEAVRYLASPAVKDADFTGRNGYRFIKSFPTGDIYTILSGLANTPDECLSTKAAITNQEYAQAIEIYKNAVYFQADMFVDRYNKNDYVPMSSDSEDELEKPNRNNSRLFKRFIKKTLPKIAPELAGLPIKYSPLSKNVIAYYSGSKNIIAVGNTFMKDVRRKLLGDAVCTLEHENWHRKLKETNLTVTETIVEDALNMAISTIRPQEGTQVSVFKDAIEHEFTHNIKNEYINPEGEIVARASDVVCYSRTPYKFDSDSVDAAHNYLASNLDILERKYHPFVGAALVYNIEEILKRKNPSAYKTFLEHLRSDKYRKNMAALKSYRWDKNFCSAPEKTPAEMCVSSPPKERVFAKINEK